MRTQKRQMKEWRKSIALLLVLLLVFGGITSSFGAVDGEYEELIAKRSDFVGNNWGEWITIDLILSGEYQGSVTYRVYQDGSNRPGWNRLDFTANDLLVYEIEIEYNKGNKLEKFENGTGSGSLDFDDGGNQIQNIYFRVKPIVKQYTLALEALPNVGGTTTGEGSYQQGQIINVSASPNSGYRFINWTRGETTISTDANFTYTMPAENVTLTANFEPLYILTLESNPTAGGTTSGGGTFTEGDTANISATANQGFTFANWTNGQTVVSTDSNYTYTMPAENVTLTANFNQIPNTYTVTLESNPENVGTLTGEGAYLEDASVNIAATDYDGYKFVNWTVKNGGQVSEADSFSHTMLAADITFVANFVPIYELTLEADPEDGGTVSDGGFFEAEDEIDVEAIASEGYAFVNWTDEEDNIVSEEASFEYTMPKRDVTLTANFEVIFELKLESNPEAGGTTSGEGFYVADEVVKVSAEANPGFTFTNWTDQDEDVVSNEATFDYTMPGQDMILTANFEADPELFILTLISNPTAGGSTNGSGAYLEGAVVSVSATAAEGYDFINWTRGDEVVSTNASFTYTMQNEDVTLTANFEQETISVPPGETPTGGGGGGGGGGTGGTGTPTAITTFTIPEEPTPLGEPVIDDPVIILEQPVPLAPPQLPRTGDSNPLHFLLAGLFLTTVGFIFRKRVTG